MSVGVVRLGSEVQVVSVVGDRQCVGPLSFHGIIIPRESSSYSQLVGVREQRTITEP